MMPKKHPNIEQKGGKKRPSLAMTTCVSNCVSDSVQTSAIESIESNGSNHYDMPTLIPVSPSSDSDEE